MRNNLYRFSRSLTLALLSLLVLTSCSDDEGKTGVEESVILSHEVADLSIGQELVVEPVFTPDVSPRHSYRWSTSNPDVATVEMQEDLSGLVTAKRKGETTIRFYAPEGKLEASMSVTVDSQNDDGVIKVLAIGNSFSEDALENYLYELAQAQNIPMVIGNLYIGGASLEQHLENAQNNAPAYSYRKIENGVKTTTPETSIETALADENWDYISLQQVSGHSGRFETYEASLPGLLEYVRERATNPEAKFVLHQTWAYAENATHSDFPNYGNDQVAMYHAIVDATRKAKIAYDLDYVVPAGTAIQNGRNTLIGDNFTRDGYHLELAMGRYTAASTWFEALTGQSVIGNDFAPASLSQTEVEIAQHAAHAAVTDPDRITTLIDYQVGEAAPLTSPVLVNFGHKLAEGWNTLGDHHQGASIGNLKDAEGEFTNISLEVTQRFNAMNENGESQTDTDLNMPSEVSTQSYYGNTRGVWQNLEIRQSVFVLSGLDRNSTYNLCFFGSRGGVGDNRETKFIVAGDNAGTAYVQTANNRDQIGCVEGIAPDFNGQITVTVTAGENNNNGSGFYYLGAMRLAPGE